MDWVNRRKKVRKVLAGKKCVYPGSVYDALSARIAEDIGFEVGMFAGSTGSLSVLGAPDLIVLTLSEFAQQALRINRSGELPLMVDADHGYGNALNVKRTVEELETAGVACLTIEDTVLPRPYGPSGKPTLLSIDEGVGKMKAALAGRQDKTLAVAGRTSAFKTTSVKDGVARIKAYEKAGVDAIFLASVTTKAQIQAARDAVKLPLLLGGGGTGEFYDKKWLNSVGVRVCLTGHQPIRAAVQGLYNTLKALRDGVAPKDLTGLASSELMNKVTRLDDYKKWTKEYLGGEIGGE